MRKDNERARGASRMRPAWISFRRSASFCDLGQLHLDEAAEVLIWPPEAPSDAAPLAPKHLTSSPHAVTGQHVGFLQEEIIQHEAFDVLWESHAQGRKSRLNYFLCVSRVRNGSFNTRKFRGLREFHRVVNNSNSQHPPRALCRGMHSCDSEHMKKDSKHRTADAGSGLLLLLAWFGSHIQGKLWLSPGLRSGLYVGGHKSLDRIRDGCFPANRKCLQKSLFQLFRGLYVNGCLHASIRRIRPFACNFSLVRIFHHA